MLKVATMKQLFPSQTELSEALKVKLVQAWIEIHQEELMRDWHLAVNGQASLESSRCDDKEE
jgi:hypothetical protein